MIQIENQIKLRETLREKYRKKLVISSQQTPDENREKEPTQDEAFLQTTATFINNHLDDPQLNLEMLYRETAMSRTQFHRKFRALTDLPPANFIKNTRLEAAMKMLKDRELPIAEVAFQTGFSSPSYFTKAFKSHFGMSPKDVKR